jgi:hypothetical protein
MINQDISEPFHGMEQVIAREDARDGTLRLDLIGGTLDARGMVLCTDHCSRQNTTKRVFSTVKTRIRVFSPTSFIRRGSSDKALRVSSRRRSSSLHEYSRL